MAAALRILFCQNKQKHSLIGLRTRQSVCHIIVRNLTSQKTPRLTFSLWTEQKHLQQWTKSIHRPNQLSSGYYTGCRHNSTGVAAASTSSFNSSVFLPTTQASELVSPAADISSPALDLSPFLADNAAATLAATTSVEPYLTHLGLGGWWPSGWIQSALEAIHIGLDVPWWTAIVITTVCIRLAIFPLVIMAQRNAAHMHNHMPTITRLQDKMTKARASGDLTDALNTSTEMMEYMKRNGVNPLKNLIPPLAQVPIFISVFAGIRGMASLPVESMKTGGLFWFTDLTVPDPIYALPVLSMITLLGVIEVGVDGVKADQMKKEIRFILRAMPFISIPFIIQFPSAMLCYWFTSNIISLLQVLLLRIPGVKPFFNIPDLIDHADAKHIRVTEDALPKKSFMEGFRETMKNMEIAAEIQERQRYNALQFKESTKTKLSKTTVVKNKSNDVLTDSIVNSQPNEESKNPDSKRN